MNHNTCPDCGVAPGKVHRSGCDVERCTTCQGQRISCECAKRGQQRERWEGGWPGKAECRALGLYCRDLDRHGVPYTEERPWDWEDRGNVQWHVPCNREDPGAHEDLNRWTALKVAGRIGWDAQGKLIILEEKQ